MSQVTPTLATRARILPLLEPIVAEFGARATARGLFSAGVSLLTRDADHGEAMAELRWQLARATGRARRHLDRAGGAGTPSRVLPRPGPHAGGDGPETL